MRTKLASQERHPALDAAIAAADRRDLYAAWRDIRHRPKPSGWSAEEIWVAIQLERRKRSAGLPHTLTKHGEAFRLVRSDVLDVLLYTFDSRKGLERQLTDQLGDPKTERLARSKSLEEAWASSAIEGAVTTRKRARELIVSGSEPRNRSERMTLNTFRAQEHMPSWVDRELSPELLLEVHRVITQGALDDEDTVGRFRTTDEIVVQDALTGETVHTPPAHEEMAERISLLCDLANRSDQALPFLHPLVRAITLHHQLAYLHPFEDGNGRTARALFLWSAFRSGYAWFRHLSPSRATHRARQAYYRSFVDVVSDEHDLTYFVRNELRTLDQEVERLVRYLDRQGITESGTSGRPAAWRDLNQRQVTVLEQLAARPGQEITSPVYESRFSVSQSTAWKDLRELVDRGFLTRTSQGRKHIYRLAKG